MSDSIQFVVDENSSGKRLDAILPALYSRERGDISRSLIQNWIRDGHVTLNGGKVKGRQSLSAGDLISVLAPEEVSVEVAAERHPLTVLYEDEDLIVIDKEPGMVVHPGAGNSGGTLVNALLHHCDGKLSRLADPDRPGIVHRLDKDTSGCLVAAKSDRAYRSLVSQFSGRETRKEYITVVEGVPANDSGSIRNQIGRHPVNRQKMSVRPEPEGKFASTDFEVVNRDTKGNWAAVRCRIHTGRTHQIRVHMKESLGCPILGDTIYAKVPKQKTKVSRLMLHAEILCFRHPADPNRMIELRAKPPGEFGPFL